MITGCPINVLPLHRQNCNCLKQAADTTLKIELYSFKFLCTKFETSLTLYSYTF